MIRHAKLSDLEVLNKLGESFKNNFVNTYKLDDYLKNDNYFILVNENDKIINSFMLIYKNIDYYELEAIYVDSVSRNKGVASSLLDFFVNNYTNNGEVILLEVSVENVGAIALYKKFQFDIINVRKKYYDGVDAYVMKKVI